MLGPGSGIKHPGSATLGELIEQFSNKNMCLLNLIEIPNFFSYYFFKFYWLAEQVSKILKAPPQMILVKSGGVALQSRLLFKYSTHWIMIRKV
jgi:hypothetical protein